MERLILRAVNTNIVDPTFRTAVRSFAQRTRIECMLSARSLSRCFDTVGNKTKDRVLPSTC